MKIAITIEIDEGDENFCNKYILKIIIFKRYLSKLCVHVLSTTLVYSL